ncbi:MAG: type II toxin-antitoxin system VapC family toxin [Chloroflexi bacterium]|nr:type II toxin-antitoxin system VapC family toxin [Chloroflexota bacterium]MBU1662471.1 type II toxin-antitoxin system VapC family toxin [Chloroflexota bacterium]
MASKNIPAIYWDSAVFLAYINDETQRADTVLKLFDLAVAEKFRIITSTESIVEVSIAGYEKQGELLDPEIEKTLDEFWNNPAVTMIEPTVEIMLHARMLIRESIPHGWILKPKDAIHLATALWVDRYVFPVREFHTYDRKLKKYNAMIGIHIHPPIIKQPRLPKID